MNWQSNNYYVRRIQHNNRNNTQQTQKVNRSLTQIINLIKDAPSKLFSSDILTKLQALLQKVSSSSIRKYFQAFRSLRQNANHIDATEEKAKEKIKIELTLMLAHINYDKTRKVMQPNVAAILEEILKRLLSLLETDKTETFKEEIAIFEKFFEILVAYSKK